MKKDYFVKLTSAAYKATDLFPKGEPLRFQIRELANKVLANLILANPTSINALKKKELMKDIKVLNSFFDLADSQNWIDPRNFLMLHREYTKIQKFVKEKPILTEVAGQLPFSISRRNGENGRQGKILELLRAKGKIRVGELIEVFPQVSRRTLIRDLEDLYRTGTIIRNGNGRGIHYSIRQ